MNYWLANSTGLHELNYPFFDYVDRLVENGKILLSSFVNVVILYELENVDI